jgi:hypothetical protein
MAASKERAEESTQVISVFKVTAAGGAVTETIFLGQGHEMVTVYKPAISDHPR